MIHPNTINKLIHNFKYELTVKSNLLVNKTLPEDTQVVSTLTIKPSKAMKNKFKELTKSIKAVRREFSTVPIEKYDIPVKNYQRYHMLNTQPYTPAEFYNTINFQRMPAEMVLNKDTTWEDIGHQLLACYNTKKTYDKNNVVFNVDSNSDLESFTIKETKVVQADKQVASDELLEYLSNEQEALSQVLEGLKKLKDVLQVQRPKK